MQNQTEYRVTGMTCSACSAHVEKAVSSLDGVEKAEVNLLTGTMRVTASDSVTPADVIRAVEHAGYGAKEASDAGETSGSGDRKEPAAADDSRTALRNLILSFVLLVPLMYVAMYHMLPHPMWMHRIFSGGEHAMLYVLVQFFLAIPVLFLNRGYFTRGFRSLLHGAPSMDTLIAVGSSAAAGYGIYAMFAIAASIGKLDYSAAQHYADNLYFESAAMILTLVSLGKYLEKRAKSKTTDAISGLMKLTPPTASVERDGIEYEIPVGEIAVGDTVILRGGAASPVDGIILEGSASFDESALTGESIPAEKTVGDRVMSASVNRGGFVKLTATQVGKDTTLSQIIRLVEEASAGKAPISKLADRVSGVFVPVVIGIALVTFAMWMIAGYGFAFALECAISVLVVSCPCALGLATPVAVMVGTGKGAQCGILFKSGEALQTLHSVTAVVLDKTGTLTEGKPRVTDIVPIGVSDEELLRLAASVEILSEHPLAQAIVAEAENRGIEPEKADNFHAEPGKGVLASWNGAKILAGNASYMKCSGISFPEDQTLRLAEEGKTTLLFAKDNLCLGIIALADSLRRTSPQAIRQLKELGLKTILLTGDNRQTANAIASRLEMDQVRAEVLPADKEREVDAMMKAGERVAMVGDGINDAPALVRADVGIAIGAGTDVAIDSADVVLMKSSVLDVVDAIRLSRSVIRNIKENLFWAFFYNCIGIPLAAGVFYLSFGWHLTPMFGSAAMSLSSIFVVSNALRLRFFKPVQRHTPQDAPESRKASVSLPAASNIALNSSETEQKGKSMQKTLSIQGMMCAHCVAHVKKALEGVSGVSSVEVDLEKGTAQITLSAPVTDEALSAAVRDAGYEVSEVK